MSSHTNINSLSPQSLHSMTWPTVISSITIIIYFIHRPLTRLKHRIECSGFIWKLDFICWSFSFPFAIQTIQTANCFPHDINFLGELWVINTFLQLYFIELFFLLSFDGDTIGGENLSETKEGWRGKRHGTESNEIHEFMARKNVESGTRFPSELRNEVSKTRRGIRNLLN